MIATSYFFSSGAGTTQMDKFHLKANKVRILKGFPARFSYMLDKTCTCDRITQGFIDVGMLDAKHKFWPDFYTI